MWAYWLCRSEALWGTIKGLTGVPFKKSFTRTEKNAEWCLVDFCSLLNQAQRDDFPDAPEECLCPLNCPRPNVNYSESLSSSVGCLHWDTLICDINQTLCWVAFRILLLWQKIKNFRKAYSIVVCLWTYGIALGAIYILCWSTIKYILCLWTLRNSKK